MATATKGKTYSKYNKTDILKGLRDTAMLVEASIKTYDQAVIDWKANAPALFAEWVEQWDPKNSYNHYPENLKAPTRNQACSDWRLQRINRSIIRIDAIEGDIVSLRSDDDVFDDMALAGCL